MIFMNTPWKGARSESRMYISLLQDLTDKFK